MARGAGGIGRVVLSPAYLDHPKGDCEFRHDAYLYCTCPSPRYEKAGCLRRRCAVASAVCICLRH
eukprot:1262385-Rhodomonas_salina.1